MFALHNTVIIYISLSLSFSLSLSLALPLSLALSLYLTCSLTLALSLSLSLSRSLFIALSPFHKRSCNQTTTRIGGGNYLSIMHAHNCLQMLTEQICLHCIILS